MMENFDFDSDFIPQSRLRSNTWPNRPIEPGQIEIPLQNQESPDTSPTTLTNDSNISYIQSQSQKAKNCRRNAWGNMSYAELITKAIENSQDQRLTLAQIYDWMVKNVSYFRDKGDNNSSAGWKNSIRHNLSLHSRFARIPNEATGKSSWWVINPEAKQLKTPRRPRDRASSMDAQKFLVKRNKAKTRAGDQKRSSLLFNYGQNNSPGTDDLHYQLSPQPLEEFNGSNGSSLHQLSPNFDEDTSPLNWNPQNENFSENLASSFATVTVQDSRHRQLSSPCSSNVIHSNNPTSPTFTILNNKSKPPSMLESLLDAPSSPTTESPILSHCSQPIPQQILRQKISQNRPPLNNTTHSMLREALLSKNPQLLQMHDIQQQQQVTNTKQFQQPNFLNYNEGQAMHNQRLSAPNFQFNPTEFIDDMSLKQEIFDTYINPQNPNISHNQQIQQIQQVDMANSSNSYPQPDLKDIDVSNDVDMSCNMDEIIKQELRMEGTLDFNFDPNNYQNGNYLDSLLTSSQTSLNAL